MTNTLKRFALLVLLGCILLLSPNFIGQQGYVLVSFANYTFEGSVISFGIAFIVAGLGLYCIWLLIRYLIVFIILPSKWLNNRHEQNHANYFQTGLEFMATGQWRLAAEQLLKVKRLSRIQTAQQLALICAIRADDPDLLTQVQDKSESSSNEQSRSMALLLACKQQNYQQALDVLKAMKFNVLKQPLPYKQAWLAVQIHTYDWLEIKKHLPKLNKQVEKIAQEADHKGTDAAWKNTLETHFTSAFQQYVKTNSVNQLFNAWQQLGKSVQQIPAVAVAFVQVLAEQKQLKHIEKILLEHEKQHGEVWLLLCLRRCYRYNKRIQMAQLFEHLQKKLNKQPKNKELLTAYAYLAAGQKDHQLAKQALEQVIYTGNNRQDTVLYANVLAELGEVRHSLEVYQKLD